MTAHTRTLTFVVGTGCSGSTALSRVVNMHPDILSVNELFASVTDPRVLAETPLSGADFWRHLATPNPVTDSMIRNGAPPPEFLYNRHPEWRYSVERTGIPAISLMVLPHLTDDPDALLDDLEPEVTSWPTRPAPQQWEAFFGALADRLGKPRAVIERSGFSLHRVPQLRAAFPDARFVHLFRDGPDCALSMSRHFGFRFIPLLWEMAERCGLESPHELTEEHAAQLPADLAPLLNEQFDAALVMDRHIPLAAFGTLWSHVVADGVQNLEEVPASMRTSLAYEALLDDPRKELTRLAEYVGVKPLPEWLDAGSALLDSGSVGAARKLAAAELAELRESCEMGMRALEGHSA